MKNSLILVSLLLLLFACQDKNSDEDIKPHLSNITESVYASVKVIPEDAYNCKSTMSGLIKKIYIQEGDQVKKGQTLFTISPAAELSNRLKDAQLYLNEAKENYLGKSNQLINLELEMANLKEQNQLDSVNYERARRLWNQNIGSKNQLERSQLAYQNSTSKVNSLINKYAQTKLNLKNQYERAQNLVSTTSTQLKDFEIQAEIDGKVFAIYKELGEFISPQESFAEIGSATNFIIEMDIDEVDISKIELGDTAIINLEAYPDKLFSSTLNYISDKKSNTTQTFKVEAEFTQSPVKLFHGLSGEANIVISRKENAIIIPSDYLISGNKVLTADGEVELKLGIKGLEFVEVLEGIDSSITILKPR